MSPRCCRPPAWKIGSKIGGRLIGCVVAAPLLCHYQRGGIETALHRCASGICSAVVNASADGDHQRNRTQRKQWGDAAIAIVTKAEDRHRQIPYEKPRCGGSLRSASDLNAS